MMEKVTMIASDIRYDDRYDDQMQVSLFIEESRK